MLVKLFMLSVRLPVNSRLLVVKFWGSQLYVDFRLHRGSVPLVPTLFEGQLYSAMRMYSVQLTYPLISI